jgi:hypothetical protein
MKMAGWHRDLRKEAEWRTAIARRGKTHGNTRQTELAEAEAHTASAQQILKALQEKIGEHPEIGEAITKLEMALNVLAIQTGGLL